METSYREVVLTEQTNMKSYKVGMICLATDQGLGYLAKDFYDNGLIDLVCIHNHSTRVNHYEWYPNAVSEQELLDKCTTLFFIETPFNWKIIVEARNRGIKTVLMPMYECTRYPLPYQPDLILTPSDLDQQYFPEATRVNVPVNVEWRLRERARVFVHNAGNGGLGGRNGTRELIESLKYVKSPIKLIIRSQVPIECDDLRVELRIGTFDDIWSEGDVFVFPEKFNGLSLPLQEAFASGMLVMTSDRFPNNTYLPREPLIPVSGYKKERIAVEFDSAVLSPEEIAKTIDEWYNKNISSYSLLGKDFNIKNTWTNLKKEYISLFNSSPNGK